MFCVYLYLFILHSFQFVSLCNLVVSVELIVSNYTCGCSSQWRGGPGTVASGAIKKNWGHFLNLGPNVCRPFSPVF